MLRVDRKGASWKLLSSSVSEHKKELLTGIYFAFLVHMFASFLIFEVERDVKESTVKTYGDALWLGLVSLKTIGYGNKVATTREGKFITSIFAIVGITFFALPAGIISTGFALKVQAQRKRKQFVRRLAPAATLIQRRWRYYQSHKTDEIFYNPERHKERL